MTSRDVTSRAASSGRAGPAPVARAVGRAPGRVNLVGEHTDYHAGLCLPLALDRVTTVVASRRGDAGVTARSQQQEAAWSGTLDGCGPGEVEGWASYAVGVLWALRQAGWELPGVDLEISSTVPVGAGLSSSAALECAVAVAVARLVGRPLTPAVREELVGACRRAETEVVGVPTGGLDQTVSLLAAEGHVMLLDFRDGTRRQVPAAWSAAGLRLLIVDTRAAHALLDGSYAARRADGEAAAAALGVATLREAELAAVSGLADPRLRARARHVVTENDRVLDAVRALEAGDWGALGATMTASHASLRDDLQVSCRELDLVVTTSLAAGALGARMTGGGFGGSAIALVPEELVATVRSAVDRAVAHAGLPEVGHLVAEPGGPAGVVVPPHVGSGA